MAGGGDRAAMWLSMGVSLVVAVVAAIVLMGGSPFGGGGSAADDEEALPPADAAASIRVRREIEDAFAFAATPGSWPHWHVDSEMVSGQIDTVAEAGDRVREHIGGDLGFGAAREVQWTMHTIKEPRYSVDGARAPLRRAAPRPARALIVLTRPDWPQETEPCTRSGMTSTIPTGGSRCGAPPRAAGSSLAAP